MTKRFSTAHPCFGSYNVRLNHSVMSKPQNQVGIFHGTHVPQVCEHVGFGGSHSQPRLRSFSFLSFGVQGQEKKAHPRQRPGSMKTKPPMSCFSDPRSGQCPLLHPALIMLPDSVRRTYPEYFCDDSLSLSVSNRKSVIERSDTTRKLSLVFKMIIFNIQ